MAKFLDTQGLTYFFNKLTGKFNKKISIQDHTPSDPVEGDLWIDTDDTTDMASEVKDFYSTGEVKTNKIWIDGRPIYRTVIKKQGIAIPSGNGTLFAHGITNIKQIINCEVKNMFESSGWTQNGAFADSDGYKMFSADSTNIYYVGTTYYTAVSDRIFIFVLEYTKTTDSVSNGGV